MYAYIYYAYMKFIHSMGDTLHQNDSDLIESEKKLYLPTYPPQFTLTLTSQLYNITGMFK